MKFVKTEDLRIGLRLAKPIYNKKGVLLYERDSKITAQGIESVKNFGLIGIYILEPAEPLPPMSEDDIEFEKFQAVEFFEIMDELQSIAKTNKHIKIYNVAQTIIKAYGRLERKINFVQNLRSADDFIFKHSLNVAILCAMISHRLNMRPTEQEELVVSAIVHAVGIVSKDERVKPTVMPEDDFGKLYSYTSHPFFPIMSPFKSSVLSVIILSALIVVPETIMLSLYYLKNNFK